MPFTFAHPAAVLPLRQYCPRYLNFPALVVGSLTPDLGYYLHNWIWSISGHSFIGSLRFDLPAGLLMLALFYLNLRPVSRLLPYPHREACSAICSAISLPDFRSIMVACISVLMGAWTHIIWDGFTHSNGWCVRKLAAITPTLFSIGSYHVTVWHLLQHFSTAFGIVVLWFAYNKYVHGKRYLKHKSLLGNRSLSCLWLLLLSSPAFIAIKDNLHLLRQEISIPSFDVFVFNCTVEYLCYFFPLICLSGIAVSIAEYLFITIVERRLILASFVKENRPAVIETAVSAHDMGRTAVDILPLPLASMQAAQPVSEHS